MNVFVTGGSGFIGRAVLKNLLALKHSITVLLLPDESEVTVKGAKVVRGDVTNFESIDGVLDGQEALIHLAGSVGFQSWKNCISINQEGTRNIMEEVRKRPGYDHSTDRCIRTGRSEIFTEAD